MNDGGILMLGKSERIAGLAERFLPYEGLEGVYARPAAGQRAAAPEGAADATPGANRASA